MMNAIATSSLPALVRSAAQKLASAETSAEVLDARQMASVAYDAAKSAGRIAKAKQAHDEIIGVVYRAQADALEIESVAKRRLADEYDAAQERGEVRAPNTGRSASALEAPSAPEVGLSHREIHEARQIRDAEAADPGVTRRTLDGLIASGEEPTKAALRRAIGTRPEPQVSDEALWLWGRLKDFEGKQILSVDPVKLLDRMTPQMRADTVRLVPMVRNFLEDMEVTCEPA